MNKKYIFFDIDGTLTDRKTNKIVPSAGLALTKLVENGHFVAIATGRACYKALPFMREVGLNNMVCCGGACLVKDGETLINEPLDLSKAKALVKEAEEKGIGYLLMLDDSIDVYAKDDTFIKQSGQRKEPTNYIIDKNLDIDKLDKIYKIYISISKSDENKLELLDSIGHIRFVEEYLCYQHDKKNEGIEKMVELLGGSLEDVIVFGDDTNDLIMFDPVWTSVAMGNACKELKEKADYVTDTNINDGIYKACLHFKLFD